MRFKPILAILTTAALGAAGPSALRAQNQTFTVTVDVPLVTVDVKVLDSKQQPMTALTEKDFIIVEDGVEQQLQNFSSVGTAYNIFLLFDRSASTENQWTFMQRAAVRFLHNVRAQDRVAIGSFDEGVTMLSEWNDSRDEAERGLNELLKRGPGGGTNLYQSLERVMQREFRNTTGRRAVIVLSDGQDSQLLSPLFTRRPDHFQLVTSVVQSTHIPLYFVALNTDKNPSSGFHSEELSRDARINMESLANISGGGMFYPKNIRDIVDLYDQVSRDLSSSYSLTYTSTHSAVRGQVHRIEVRVHGASVKQSRNSYVTP